jgi:hypothetical protein
LALLKIMNPSNLPSLKATCFKESILFKAFTCEEKLLIARLNVFAFLSASDNWHQNYVVAAFKFGFYAVQLIKQ